MKSFQNNVFSIKTSHFVQTPTSHLPISPPKSFSYPSSNQQTKCLKTKTPNFTNSQKDQIFNAKIPFLLDFSAAHSPLMFFASFPLPCFAAGTEEMSLKINIESVLVSIDDFFNQYPYFVASLAFVWLVVIPLAEEYMNKYKFISSIDAFRKLRDEPSSQLLDIRKKKSVGYLKTPNLKILDKVALNVEFVEDCEEEFKNGVLKRFQEPGNTIIIVVDNFDGNSLKVAKLLFKNGFKETYAIKGGLLGKDGWQAIQETLLPPSVHVYAKKESKKSPDKDDENRPLLTSSIINQEIIQNVENGYMKSGKSTAIAQHIYERPLSPYSNFKDLKPPSSPTPSKP